MAEMSSLIVRFESRGVNQLNRDLRSVSSHGATAERSMHGVTSSTTTATSSTGRLASGLKLLGGAFAAVQLAKYANELIHIADDYKALEVRIKNATMATGEFGRVQEELSAISNEVGAAMKDAVTLFDRFRIGAQELGRSNDEILRLVESVNKLGVVSGASQEELKNATRQLSQAMAGGIVRAEEFNSIVENTPRLAESIATGLGKSVGELRQMVIAGELLADDVFESILSQTKKIDEEFARMPLSVDTAFQRLSNNFQTSVGRAEKSLGIAESWVNFIDRMASGLKVAEGLVFGAIDPQKRLVELFQERLDLVMSLDELEKSRSNAGKLAAQARIKEIDAEMLKLDQQVKATAEATLKDAEARRKKREEMERERELQERLARGRKIQVSEEQDFVLMRAAADQRAAEALEYLRKQQEKENAEKLKSIEANRSLIEALETEHQLMQLSDKERFIQINLRKLNAEATEEEIARVKELSAVLFDEQQIREQSNAFADAWVKATERIDESFASAWEGAFDSFEDFSDSILDSFKKLLAEMAHLAVTKPIVIQLTQGLSDTVGGVQQYLGYGSTAGSTGITSAGLTEGGTVAGAGSTAGLGAGTAAGVFAAVVGIYRMYNDIKDGLYGVDDALTGNFADIKYSNQLNQYGGVGLGDLAASYVAALHGNFVDSLENAVEHLFGSNEYYTRGFGVDLGVSGSQFSGQTFRHEKASGGVFGSTKNRIVPGELSEDFDLALTTAFSNMREGVLAGLNTLGIEVSQAALDSFSIAATRITTDNKNDEEVKAAIDEWFSGVTGQFVDAVSPESIQNIEHLNTLAAAITGVNQALSIVNAQMLDFSADGAMAAESLIAMNGGIETLLNRTAFFYENFFTEQEKFDNLTQSLQSTFGTLNIAMPETRQGFKELVTSMELMGESGREAYTALLAIAPSFDSFVGRLEFFRSEVTDLYANVLGRTPDTAGFEAYVDALANGSMTVDQIAAEMRSSTEYYTNQLTEIYQSVLDRAPDPAGFNYWLSALESGSVTLDQATQAIANSVEALSESLTTSGYKLSPGRFNTNLGDIVAGLQDQYNTLASGFSREAELSGLTGRDREKFLLDEWFEGAVASIKDFEDVNISTIGGMESIYRIYNNRLGDINERYGDVIGNAETLVDHTNDLATAHRDVADAYRREQSALESIISQMASLGDQVRNFDSELVLGDLSVLSTQDKYQFARREFNQVSDLAKQGDVSAIAQYDDVARAFLSASREYQGANASVDNFELIRSANQEIISVTERQMKTAEDQLAQMTKSVEKLTDIEKKVLTLEEAITALRKVQQDAGALTVEELQTQSETLNEIKSELTIAGAS
ncbi:MAG: tape measure protein [Pseudomonadales bacterium]|nr:tape measure protein [Pseudomonadales bacterium]